MAAATCPSGAGPRAPARGGTGEDQPMPTTLEVMLKGKRLRVQARTEIERAFWAPFAQGEAHVGWEDETLDFVAARAARGVVFVDIGAWIGPVSLLAASRGARVLALEPDPVARAALEENLALNGLRAEIVPAALHANGGGLTLFGGRRGLGGSMTSALGVHRGEPVHVPTVTVEEVADRAGEGAALMKVDIEGHEYSLGPELARLRARLGGRPEGAALHLSLHPRLLVKKLRRSWSLFPTRRAFEATRDLLAGFGDAPVRVSGEDGGRLDEAALRARFERRGGVRNFAVEIGG